jgi:amidase
MPAGHTSISRHTPATLGIRPGESIELRVEDWCHGRLSADPKSYGCMQQPRIPVAGPVDVAGAEAGDCLAIDVLGLVVDQRGTAARIAGAGPLAPRDGNTRVWDVRVASDQVELAGLRFAAAPMIGVIGTRPDCDEPLATRCTGAYGGNLDTREITVGTRVELPVLTPGGGLFVGDLHAAMGDGELTATGCEVGGTVWLRVDLIKGQSIPGPRLRFGNCWMTLATSSDFAHACRDAAQAMHHWITRERGMSDDQAAFIIGMAGGIGISQVVNPSGPTVKVMADWGRVK